MGQVKCLTIGVSHVRNRTKLFLPWYPRECHDMNEDAHFLCCTMNFLWGSHCLPACPGRWRSNSRFRQSQVESRSVKTPGYIPKENCFLSPTSLVLLICTGSKGLAFFLSFTSFWYGGCFRTLIMLLLLLGREQFLLLGEHSGWRPGNQKKVQTNSANNVSWTHAKQTHVVAEKALIFLGCEWIKVVPNFKTKVAGKRKINAVTVRKLVIYCILAGIYTCILYTELEQRCNILTNSYPITFIMPLHRHRLRESEILLPVFLHQWWMQGSKLKGSHVTASEARQK